MQLELKDKVVLVTGGSKGIGLACAQAFQAEGARIAICSRSRANIDAGLAAIPGGRGYSADLTRAEDALRLVESVEAELGPIDVLVNSAGAARRTAVDDLTPDAWRAAMDAKYFTYINVVDPVVKRMGARGAGVIVNVIGQGGKIASTTHLAGGAANAALMLATVGLAAAYAPRGVRVVGINPGVTRTGRVAAGIGAEARQQNISEQQAEAAMMSRIPLGRMAEPEEIAQMVLFLASARASYVTGVIIGMDGAQTTTII